MMSGEISQLFNCLEVNQENGCPQFRFGSQRNYFQIPEGTYVMSCAGHDCRSSKVDITKMFELVTKNVQLGDYVTFSTVKNLNFQHLTSKKVKYLLQKMSALCNQDI